MEKIDSQIKNIENKISSNDGRSKFFRGLFKVIMYIHVGFAGSFAVGALKDLAIGNITGLFMLGGLFVSGVVFGGIGELIQTGFRNKKEKLQIRLHGLEMTKRELERKKKKNNNDICIHVNYNSIGYNQDKEMKLTLRK